MLTESNKLDDERFPPPLTLDTMALVYPYVDELFDMLQARGVVMDSIKNSGLLRNQFISIMRTIAVKSYHYGVERGISGEEKLESQYINRRAAFNAY